jgi:hypothetical protein
MKSKLIIAVLSLMLVSSQANAAVVAATASAPIRVPAVIWVIFGCSGGVVVSAVFANFVQHRALSAVEAGTCGLAYWFKQPKRG